MKTSLISLAAFTGALAIVGSAFAFSPENVECIAPADPGGGWDFTCRQVGKLMYDLKMVPSPVKVTNMSGGGGGVAYSYVISKRGEDKDLLVAASTATTTRLAQNQFAGLTADKVRWVAALGADYGVIVVAKDSPFKTLKDMMDTLKADPGKVAFSGGSAVGGWDHLKVLLLAKAAGVDNVRSIKYLAFSGGGGAITQLLGGHTQAMTGDVTEIQGQLAAGNLRVLAILSEERLPTEPDMPTAKEQGYDVIGANWRGFYVPKGIDDDAFEGWGAMMEKLYASEEWKTAMKNNGLAPFWRGGKAMDEFVTNQIKQINDLSKEVGLIK